MFNLKDLIFNLDNPEVYPPKPASLLLAEIASEIVKPGDKVLDACTGSGVIAISIAKFVKQAEVVASDINPEAILIAEQNAKKNNVDVHFVVSDLYQSFSDDEFDIITVHPPAVPHITNEDWGMTNGMQIATNGGDDGADLIVRSILEAKRCLKIGGKLLLLLPHWSNVNKIKLLLADNYADIFEISKKQVEFFPMFEGTPTKKIVNHVKQLAKQGIIDIEFKNGEALSFVSVIQAVKTSNK